MSGAARMLLQRGALITGSDRMESATLQQLSCSGATVYIGHEACNLPNRVDLVVASAAVPENNPELLAARARGLRIVKYSELLGLLMARTTGVAVAGTHGKSTTTAMTTHCCRQAGLDPSFVIGAEVPQLGGGAGAGSGSVFIVEACEYDCSFLNLAPTHAAILNIEEDHLDYYRDLDHIVEAFRAFARLVPAEGVIVYNHDDPTSARAVAGCEQAISFGLQPGATWRARPQPVADGLSRFELFREDACVAEVRLSVPGEHNIFNALAATALAVACGASLEPVVDALASFSGAQRRLTHRGCYQGIDILDDYAHHPTEIRATLRALRARYSRRPVRVVFQPHQHSRTRFFLQDFAQSFELADEVIVPDIYFVRDSESERQLISSRDLVARIRSSGGRARYIPDLDDIAAYLAGAAREEDVVLTMGAGDVWKVADDMVSRLGIDR